MDGPGKGFDDGSEGRAALWVSLRERLAMVAVGTVLICVMAVWLDPDPRFMVSMMMLAMVLLAVTGLAALGLRRLLLGRRR